VWFLKIFIPLVSSDSVAISDGIQSALTVVFSLIIVNMLGSLTLKKIYYVWAFSYSGLLALLVSPTSFLILSTFSSASFMSITKIFRNNLNAQNISNDERAMFDNYQFILSNVFRIIGCYLAYTTMFASIPYYYMWVVVYISFDIDLLIIIFLIKNNKLKYESLYNIK